MPSGKYLRVANLDEEAFLPTDLKLLSTTSFAAGYPEDNASWLLLDKKYGRYYVIRVTMDTYTTGTATISQTSDAGIVFQRPKIAFTSSKSPSEGGFQLYSKL